MEEQAYLRWPEVTRICFGPGEPAHLDACVGWAQAQYEDLSVYVEGYRQAAEALFESVSNSRHRPDCSVFPLVFLWRQHLELALKNIIGAGRRLAGEPWGFPEDHRLLTLWERAKKHIIAHGSADAPELSVVEANLREFHTIDPQSVGFRYPIARNRKGEDIPSLPTSLEYVNLRVLHEGMQAIANFLSAVESEFSRLSDLQSEILVAYSRV